MRPGRLEILAALLAAIFLSPVSAQRERPLSSSQKIFFASRRDAPPAEAIDPDYDALGPLHSLTTEPLSRHFIDDCPQATPCQDVFHGWSFSLTYLTGFLGINLGPLDKVPFDMLPEIVRLNCVWNSPRPRCLFHGSWEGIFELDTLPVVNGPASIVVGSSLLLRYNFGTNKHHRLVPYYQVGGGGMYTDAYAHGSPVLSSGFEFIVQTGVGANLFLTDRLSLTAEWNYYHFSNGGIILPNISVNTMGGLIGLTYYFGRRTRE